MSPGKPVSVRVAEALGWTDTRPPVLVVGEWKGRPPRYLGLGFEVRDIRAALAARSRGGFSRAGIHGGPARGRAAAWPVPGCSRPAPAGGRALRRPAKESGMTKGSERVARAALAVGAAVSPALAARWAEALFFTPPRPRKARALGP